MIGSRLPEENPEQEKKEFLIIQTYPKYVYGSSSEPETPFSPVSRVSISSVVNIDEPDPLGRRELIQATAHAFYDKCTILADTNYWVITFYTLVLPYFIEKWGNHLPNVGKASEAGTIIDTTFLLLISSSQLLGHVTHRSQVTKTKGALNLLNTIQLPLFSFLQEGAYALPSVVTAIGTGGVISTLDTIHNHRLYQDKKYWLKDTFSQIKMLNHLIEALDNEVKEMKISIVHSPSYFFDKALKSKEKRLKDCRDKREKLEKDLIFRVKKMRLDHEDLTFIQKYILRQKKKDEYTDFIGKLENALILEEDGDVIITVEKKEKTTADELKEKYKESVLETVFWIVGSTGMSLLIVPECDGYTIPVFAVAAGLKFYQTIPTIFKWAESTFGFFKDRCCRTPGNLEINSPAPLLSTS